MLCFVIHFLFFTCVHDALKNGVGVMFMWERGKW